MMNRDQLERLKNIDALVLEHVLEWPDVRKVVVGYDYDSADAPVEQYMWKAADPEGRLLHEVPNYTLNLSKAWRIVEHLGRTHEVRLDRIPHPDSGTARWICEFTPLDKSHPGYYEVADTAELAICLSALQAKGVEAPAE